MFRVKYISLDIFVCATFHKHPDTLSVTAETSMDQRSASDLGGQQNQRRERQNRKLSPQHMTENNERIANETV